MSISNPNFIRSRRGKELSGHGTVAFPVACYRDDIEHDPVPWHWHEEFEAAVAKSGDVLVSVGEEKYTVRKGEGFFINANLLHAVLPLSPGAMLHSVVFHPRLVGGGIDSIYWQSYIQPVLSNPTCRFLHFSSEPIRLIEQTWQFCASEPPGYEFEVRSALSRLIFLICCSFPALTKEVPASRKALRYEMRIKQMLQFIQKNYPEDITNADVAAAAKISESECLRCFHSTIGTSPIQYLKQFRIQEAARMIAGTNTKIADIGIACGFRNTSYFTKTFREQKGCTPREYRCRNSRGTSGSVRP